MSEHTNELSRRSFIAGAAIAGASAALLTWNPVQAFAVTSAEKKAEAQAALGRLRDMQEKLDQSTAQYEDALDAQAAAQARMDEAQTRIDEASGKISTLQDHLGTRARSMYRSGSSSVIDLLLGATSFQAFTQNWSILNNMNEEDAKMVDETKTLRAEVQSEKEEYARQEAVAAEQAATAKRLTDEGQRLVDELQHTYNTLSAEAQQLLQQEEAARQAEAAAEVERQRQRVAAEQAAANRNNGTSSGDSSGGGSSSKPSGGGNIKVPAFSGGSCYERAVNSIGCFKYHYGAVGPEVYDCSAFVSYCLTGNRVGRLATSQVMYNWPEPADPQPGDIAARSGHVGIYAGGGQMIHCSSTYNKVVKDRMQKGMHVVRRP